MIDNNIGELALIVGENDHNLVEVWIPAKKQSNSISLTDYRPGLGQWCRQLSNGKLIPITGESFTQYPITNVENGVVQVKVLLVFFANQESEMLVYSPGFGVVCSLAQTAFPKKNCLYYGWISYFHEVSLVQIEVCLKMTGTKWLVDRWENPVPKQELSSIPFDDHFNIDDLSLGVIVEKDASRSVAKVFSSGNIVDLYIDNPSSYPIEVGRWVKFYPMTDFANNLCAISPYIVTEPKGVMVLEIYPALVMSADFSTLIEPGRIFIPVLSCKVKVDTEQFTPDYLKSRNKIDLSYSPKLQDWEVLKSPDEQFIEDNKGSDVSSSYRFPGNERANNRKFPANGFRNGKPHAFGGKNGPFIGNHKNDFGADFGIEPLAQPSTQQRHQAPPANNVYNLNNCADFGDNCGTGQFLFFNTKQPPPRTTAYPAPPPPSQNQPSQEENNQPQQQFNLKNDFFTGSFSNQPSSFTLNGVSPNNFDSDADFSQQQTQHKTQQQDEQFFHQNGYQNHQSNNSFTAPNGASANENGSGPQKEFTFPINGATNNKINGQHQQQQHSQFVEPENYNGGAPWNSQPKPGYNKYRFAGNENKKARGPAAQNGWHSSRPSQFPKKSKSGYPDKPSKPLSNVFKRLTGIVCARDSENQTFDVYTPQFPDTALKLSFAQAEANGGIKLGDWLEFDLSRAAGDSFYSLTKINDVFETQVVNDTIVIVTLSVFPPKHLTPCIIETPQMVYPTEFIDNVWDVQRMVTSEMANTTVQARIVYRPGIPKSQPYCPKPWRIEQIIAYA